MLKKSILLLALSLPFFYSCKKKGCTDKNALNYSSKAKKDDGSCVTIEEVKSVIPQNLYVEQFDLTFNSGSSFDSYVPNFNYESGDAILIETVNQYGEWTPLPYIFSVDVHVEGSYDTSGEIWAYLKNDDGTSFFPSSNVTQTFRAALIKKNGIDENPNIKDMTISELLEE